MYLQCNTQFKHREILKLERDLANLELVTYMETAGTDYEPKLYATDQEKKNQPSKLLGSSVTLLSQCAVKNKTQKGKIPQSLSYKEYVTLKKARRKRRKGKQEVKFQ